ncbi:MAG TPA: translation initiation factor IF-3 [Phycisphaerales bacterium]|nr:translation initiation factor IF-3 [Phycisphaerales bacterium]
MGRRGRRHHDKRPRFEHRINERIRARAVQVIDDEGKNLGNLHPREAVKIAKSKKLDLVEISPNANPPVCKMMDYGKWRYERDKRKKEQRDNTQALREVKMRPKIGDHDFEVKTKQVERLLNSGDKVKVTLRFRGREVVHQHLAKELLQRVGDEVSDAGNIVSQPTMQGRTMSVILAPA